MSDFLINLARRGAGLPAGQSNARPPVTEYQALSENLEPDQVVETSEPTAFDPGGRPTFETTQARRARTAPMSPVQAPRVPQIAQAPQVAQAPEAMLTPAPASLIQRSEAANNQTANPPSETRSESSGPSVVDQTYAIEATITSRGVVRRFSPPINERPSTSSAPARPLTENVLVATPRSSANEKSQLTDSAGSSEPLRAILSDAGKALQIVRSAETREHAPEGERQRERDPIRLDVVTLAPRLPVIEDQRLARVSNVVPAAAADVASMPIHVRIAKVEVRAAPATVPPSAAPVGPAPIGFGSYYRLRTYRS